MWMFFPITNFSYKLSQSYLFLSSKVGQYTDHHKYQYLDI